MNAKNYTIAGLGLRLHAPHFTFGGLAPFETRSRSNDPVPDIEVFPCARVAPDSSLGIIDTFDFPDSGAECRLCGDGADYLFTLTPRNGSPSVHLLLPADGRSVSTDYKAGSDPALFRFGLWMACNIRAAARSVLAVHSSAVVHNGAAVLFLGESGTGKSTHTRLWLEHVPDTRLLNDDSPFVRAGETGATAYGSPWSGKTPCYRNENYPIRAFVRLSQAPANRIERLPTLRAYAALQPSFPPSFAHDERLFDLTNALISSLLSSTPVYHLACLPDADAARLAAKTLFGA